jgi:hypothetical protein
MTSDKADAILIAAVLLTAGCGRPYLGVATGIVTSGGKPMARGIVQFESRADGRAYIAPLDDARRFRFQEAAGHSLPPGRYAVAVKPPTTLPSLTFVPPRETKPEDYSDIPPRYHDPATSGLAVELKADTNEPLRFDLE